MYRLIRDTNNMCQPPYVTYHIEKLVRFLWWTWWSREYLADPDGHHWYSDQQEAENCLRIMNGIRPWVVREEVGVR